MKKLSKKKQPKNKNKNFPRKKCILQVDLEMYCQMSL